MPPHKIRFVCNWFNPRRGAGEEEEEAVAAFEEGKAEVVSNWWRRWLNLFGLMCLLACVLPVSKSDHPSPLSTCAPCWAVKINLQMWSLFFFPLLHLFLALHFVIFWLCLFFFFFFFELFLLVEGMTFTLFSCFRWQREKKKKKKRKSAPCSWAAGALMRWWILS